MNTPICRHIKANGTQCGSPSLTNGSLCYFHNRLHQRHRRFRHTEATRGYLIPGHHIELTALEDAESVQLAISMVINALATGALEIKRATALLYGLQLASINSARLRLEPDASKVVRSIASSPDGLDYAISGTALDLDDSGKQEEN